MYNFDSERGERKRKNIYLKSHSLDYLLSMDIIYEISHDIVI